MSEATFTVKEDVVREQDGRMVQIAAAGTEMSMEEAKQLGLTGSEKAKSGAENKAKSSSASKS